ncbi:hypothetical protein [Chitinilyticum piscinae]|uniref:Uncharacterized protein n=1 Tax=Chitinilyticum piscinae TaxID=2866724 RepID=A0A8J7FK18_9NEIS|nr:hypothetical protein [Chitinilyticum piscinae]MBE9610855.1 hypothetical protein [Chitinilyticum piscinae]
MSRISFIYSSGDFDINELVAWVKGSGRTYVIIGGDNTTFDTHSKPGSLDYWLRSKSSSKDVRQSCAELIAKIVDTGLFVEAQDICPETERLCNSLRLVNKM